MGQNQPFLSTWLLFLLIKYCCWRNYLVTQFAPIHHIKNCCHYFLCFVLIHLETVYVQYSHCYTFPDNYIPAITYGLWKENKVCARPPRPTPTPMHSLIHVIVVSLTQPCNSSPLTIHPSFMFLWLHSHIVVSAAPHTPLMHGVYDYTHTTLYWRPPYTP